jgi:molecular chaperone DnaJ
MTTEVDFYELLECERTADDATLKSAYRKLAIKYHPDKNDGCKDHEAKFKAISEAYDCLKDPQKRAAYDRFGHAAFKNGMGGGGGPHGAQDFGAFSDIFESVFGEFMGGAAAAVRSCAAPTCATTWRSASRMPSRQAPARSPSTCRACATAAHGTGARPGTQAIRPASSATATARCARSRASSWSSGPARSATAPAK